MSRIGKKIIIIPSAVTVARVDNVISVKSPKGELSLRIPMELSLELSDKEIKIMRKAEHKKARSLHGLFRTLIHNMIVGLDQGFKKELELKGVGYRASLSDKNLMLNLGFSHPIEFKAPDGISFSVEKNIISLSGFDKQKVGEITAQIRRLRPPEHYKGKGIRYVGEYVVLKPGKAGKVGAAGGAKA